MGAEQNAGWAGAGVAGPAVPEASAANPGARVVITGDRLLAWGRLSALSLVDQGLTSGAGFAVNLLLARWMAPDSYGAFAVAFAGFLFVSGFHNVLLLEPMSVMGPSRHAGNLPAYFRAQIVIHMLLVGALSAALLLVGAVLWRVVPGSPLAGAVAGGGLALPFLLLLGVVRRMCYVMRRPSIAVGGSAFYLLFVAAGLFVLGHVGWLSSFTVFLLMGFGSALAAVLPLLRLGLRKAQSANTAGASWREALKENWSYGRWLVGGTTLYSISSQTQMFLVAGLLGLGAAGVMRAMQLPMLVMWQTVVAAGLLVLPAFSYDFGRGQTERLRHKALLVSLGLGALSLCFAAVLAFSAGEVERLLFGGRYAAYGWLIPVLALIPVANGFATGYSMALRASGKPYFDLIANAFAAPTGLVSAVYFTRWWGLAGACASMVCSFVVYMGATYWIYYSVLRPRITEARN